MAMTKTRTGPVVSASPTRCSPGRRPVTTVRTATAMSSHGTMMFHHREVGFHWLSRTPAGYGTPIAARFDREPSSPRSASTGSLGLAHERRMPPQPDPQVSGLEHAEREREAGYRLALGDPGSDFALVGPVDDVD